MKPRLHSRSILLLIYILSTFLMGASNLGGGGCGNNIGSDSSSSSEDETFTIGGSITGLSGTVVLQNNSGDNLTLTADGSFTFSTALTDGATYSVSVLTQPSGQTCTPSNNTGTLEGANVTNVTVTCSTNSTFTVGGTLSNLGGSASIVLQNNSGDNLTLTSNGSFTFSSAIVNGATYNVTVLTNPSRQSCSVSNGSGSISGSNVSNIEVTCVTTNPVFYSISAQNGNFGGISGADAICMSDSSKPATGTYKALLVDGTTRRACSTANCSGGVSENIDWVLQPSTTYYRTNQTTAIMTTNSAGIFPFGTLTNSFLGNSTEYWTGLENDWTTSSFNCTAWTKGSGPLGNGGGNNNTDSRAISLFTRGCSNTQPIICVEQ